MRIKYFSQEANLPRDTKYAEVLLEMLQNPEDFSLLSQQIKGVGQ